MIAIDLRKQQALDADPKATIESVLLKIYIQMETQQCFSYYNEYL